MSHKRLTNRLIVLLVLEVLFEFGMVNFSRYLHENSSVLFLCLDKFLFLGLLILLNNWLTQRKIPFSLKLNKDQQKGILVVAGILIIMGLMNVKNFLNAIAVGFIAGTTEEYLFRGVVLLTLLELFDHFQKRIRRILLPMIISSILFGSEHFLNLYSQSFSATMIQVLQTTAMGFVFASIFVRTNNLLFPMLCHFSLDYVVTILWGMQNSSNISFGSAIGVSVFYLIVGLFILMPILTDNKLKVEK